MRAVSSYSDDMLTYPYDNYITPNMTISVTIIKFPKKILVGIHHTKCATKVDKKRMPKQDKEVGHKCHNFAPRQAGNPLSERGYAGKFFLISLDNSKEIV